MTVVPFDTLKLSRKLESGGFTHDQANTAAEALADAMSGAELATKADLNLVKADLNAFRSELKADLNALRAEMKADSELMKRDLTIRLGSMQIVLVGILLGAMRLMIG